jgi:hypothetical protein
VGSLAMAAYGAVGGIGQGLQTVGKAEMATQMEQKKSDVEQQRQEAFERLRAAEEEKLQGTNISAQQAAQERSEKFTKEQTEAGYVHAGGAAAATRAFEAEQKTADRAAAQKRAETTGQYRVAARQAGAPAPKQVPEFSYRTLTEQPSLDGKTPGRSYVQITHRSGLQMVQVNGGVDPKTGQVDGGLLLPHGANDTSFPDPKSVARPPVNATQYLMDHPESWGDYYSKYHQLPADWLPKYQASKQNPQPQQQGLPAFARPGTTAGPSTPLGGNARSADEQDAQDDEEDAQNERDYANTGDAGPQATDTAPAQ